MKYVLAALALAAAGYAIMAVVFTWRCTSRTSVVVVSGSQDNGEFSINLFTCEWCGHLWNDAQQVVYPILVM